VRIKRITIGDNKIRKSNMTAISIPGRDRQFSVWRRRRKILKLQFNWTTLHWCLNWGAYFAYQRIKCFELQKCNCWRWLWELKKAIDQEQKLKTTFGYQEIFKTYLWIQSWWLQHGPWKRRQMGSIDPELQSKVSYKTEYSILEGVVTSFQEYGI
jgi:hypothetical protein